MNRANKILNEIREFWFKDHKAELINCGEVTILNWKNPNNNNYYIRYVFDGYKMYISGDVGDAVFNLTWKADVHSFDGMFLGYFLSKMSTCSNGKHIFNGCEAEKKLVEWRDKLLEDNDFEDDIEEKEEFMETIESMISDATSCGSEEQWAWEYVNEKYNDFINEHDPDYCEWIYDIGNVTPYHNYAFLLGLQMASEQLKKNPV